MNKVILTIGLVLICTKCSYSQMGQTRSRTTSTAQTSATASEERKTIDIASGTRLSAELQNTLDARKAKVGDEVVLKTTQAIKSEGRTVVNKGARLIGHVTDVTQKTEANGESRVAVLFDRLESGSLDVGIAASIVSISRIQVSPMKNDAEIDTFGSSSTSARTSGGQRSSSSGTRLGGVAGGVINTASTATGDVLGNTTAAVGSTVNGSTNAAGGVTSGVGRSLGRIRISESTDASAANGSVLSLQGDNLRIEKGTTFTLELTQAVGAGIQP